MEPNFLLIAVAVITSGIIGLVMWREKPKRVQAEKTSQRLSSEMTALVTIHPGCMSIPEVRHWKERNVSQVR